MRQSDIFSTAVIVAGILSVADISLAELPALVEAPAPQSMVDVHPFMIRDDNLIFDRWCPMLRSE
jgi:hypothetical protein